MITNDAREWCTYIGVERDTKGSGLKIRELKVSKRICRADNSGGWWSVRE